MIAKLIRGASFVEIEMPIIFQESMVIIYKGEFYTLLGIVTDKPVDEGGKPIARVYNYTDQVWESSKANAAALDI